MRSLASIGFLFALVNCPTGPLFASQRAVPFGPHPLAAAADGASPFARLVHVNGILYGTTPGGGKYGQGTVFAVTTAGEESVLHSFGAAGDGAAPMAALIDVNAVLYGTTSYGGRFGRGTVFAVTAAGKERVLHSFGGVSDGSGPAAALIDVNGILYGTTTAGGNYGQGTLFAVTTAGDERVLHSFKSGEDGIRPVSGLINVDGVLYGTTSGGGQHDYTGGVVFKADTIGHEHVLHTFYSGSEDGLEPYYGALIDVKGVLYGTTVRGGKYGANIFGDGTVFAVTPAGVEHVLYSFGSGSEDGIGPNSADLVDVNGVLYGTTQLGGKYGSFNGGYGTVFALTTAGKEHVLHSFAGGEDGEAPVAGLIDVNGVLYGTTSAGGKYGYGTVFALTTAGTKRVLHAFAGPL